MTTYGSTVNLSEQQLWALEASIEFYLHPEAEKLRKSNPDFFKFHDSIDSLLMKMVESKKLREGMYLNSSYSRL